MSENTPQQSVATRQSTDPLSRVQSLAPSNASSAQIIDLSSEIQDANDALGDCWFCSFNRTTDDAAAHWKTCMGFEHNSVRMTLDDHAQAKRIAKFEFGRLKLVTPAGGLASALDFLVGVWQRDEIQGLFPGKPLRSLESVADGDLAKWSCVPLYNVVHRILSKARYQTAAMMAIEEAASEVFGNERARQSSYGELPSDPDGYRSEPWMAEELQWLRDFIHNAGSSITADVAKAFNDHFRVSDSKTGMGKIRDPVSVRLKIESLFSRPGPRQPADLSEAEKAWLRTVFQLSNDAIVQSFQANAAKSGWRSRSNHLVLNYIHQCRAQAAAASVPGVGPGEGTGQRSAVQSSFLRQLANMRCTPQQALELFREKAQRDGWTVVMPDEMILQRFNSFVALRMVGSGGASMQK